MDGSLASLHILSQKAFFKAGLVITSLFFISWNFVLQEAKQKTLCKKCVLRAEPAAASLQHLETLLTANTFMESLLKWDSKSCKMNKRKLLENIFTKSICTWVTGKST